MEISVKICVDENIENMVWVFFEEMLKNDLIHYRPQKRINFGSLQKAPKSSKSDIGTFWASIWVVC